VHLEPHVDADGHDDERVDPTEPFADAAHDSPQLERSRGRSAAFAGLLLTVALFLAVTVASDPADPWVQPFDDGWLAWAESNRNDAVVQVAKVLDVVGSTWVTLPVRIAAILILLMRRRWLQLAAFSTAIVVSELFIGPLKSLIDRPRPPSIVETTAASFPSGHSIAAAVTAFGLVAAFLPRGRRRLHWTVGAGLVAASMAWSRTYLGAHWATDTIAGTCIGVGLAVLSETAFEEARRRYALRATSPARSS
jgi:membrane-associated phospholipid phosphatase